MKKLLISMAVIMAAGIVLAGKVDTRVFSTSFAGAGTNTDSGTIRGTLNGVCLKVTGGITVDSVEIKTSDGEKIFYAASATTTNYYYPLFPSYTYEGGATGSTNVSLDIGATCTATFIYTGTSTGDVDAVVTYRK